MNTVNGNQLRFYDGRTHFIDKKRMSEFEARALTDRFFAGENVDVAAVIEELGPVSLHYSNVQPWAEEIPDINPRSARIYTIWAEEKETKEIVVILKGFFILTPFQWGKKQSKIIIFLETMCRIFQWLLFHHFRRFLKMRNT